MAILPFTGRGLVDPVITLVKASVRRKQAAETRMKFYRDRQADDLYELIRAKWAEPTDFRLFQVNLVRKVVDKRAMVYRAAPFREFDGWNQDRGEEVYRDFGANLVLKKANRLTKLMKTAMLQVAWNGDRPAVHVLTPNILDVEHAGDPEVPTRVIVTHPGEKEQDTTYSEWTAGSYRRLDYRGRTIPVLGNPDGVNPYGALPFVPLFDYAPDDRFFLDGGDDLIEAQRAVNVALTNLWRALEWHSHGQAWVQGVPNEEAAIHEIGPTRVLHLPGGATFNFASPETPVEDVLTAIEFLIKQTAIANDLPPTAFELEPKAESGTARLALTRDLLEAREDDLALWRRYEARLFEVIKVVAGTHAPGSIPAGAALRIDFGEVTESLDEGQRLEAYQRRLDMGLWSPVDALMADNPDVRTREEALAVLQQRREESAVLGTAFAGPSFGDEE